MFDYDHVLTHLSGLTQATSEADLLSSFGQVVAEVGGTGFAVACIASANEMLVTHHRGLNGWCEHFVGARYARFCPITERIGSSDRPFHWTDVSVDGQANPDAQFVLDAASEFGVTDGLIVPMRKINGERGNVFVSIDSERLLENDEQWLVMLSMAFHTQLMHLTAVGDAEEAAQLSMREREVLSWLAEGKSAEDVGCILKISAATVMFHYRSVAVRFGTLNRTHTVVEAMRRGALRLN